MNHTNFLLLLLDTLFLISNLHAVTWDRNFANAGKQWADSVQQTSDGGYIVAGLSRSCWVAKMTQVGDIEWQKVFGSPCREAVAIRQTADRGYIVLADGDNSNIFLLVRLTATGQIVWQRSYQASVFATGFSSSHLIDLTNDGGYIVGASTYLGGTGYLIKVDAVGNVTWTKKIQGIAFGLSSVQTTTDGGFVAATTKPSQGGAAGDLCVLKFDGNGNIEWQKSYDSGSPYDFPTVVKQTRDGGYIIAGYTGYPWVLRLKSDGATQWQKLYLGSNHSQAVITDLVRVPDGFVLAGTKGAVGNVDLGDLWLMKINILGGVVWEATRGGKYIEGVDSIAKTSDDGYVVAGGGINPSGIDNNGDVIKFNAKGQVVPGSGSCSPAGFVDLKVRLTNAIPKNTSVKAVNVTLKSTPTNVPVSDLNVEIGSLCGPFISHVSPTAAAVGAVVTIAGKGFGSLQGKNRVTFGSISAGAALEWSETKIMVNVPPGAQSGQIRIHIGPAITNPINFTVQ